MKVDVSVVVPTFNRNRDVNDAVNSLLHQSLEPLEIIVIDDGSSPPIHMDFHSGKVKVARFDQNVGLSNARNFGISIARGDYIAFMDDDAIADRDWLKEIRLGLNVAQIVGGQLKPLYQVSAPDWWSLEDFGGYAGVGNISSELIWGCNMAIKADVFAKVGLFNPILGRNKGKLLSCEEADFFDRARKKEFIFKFIRAAVVNHKVPYQRMTFDYIIRWSYYAGKSLRVWNGYQPLKTFLNLLWCIFKMADPHIIVSEKPVRIKKIALMAQLLGRLF